MVGSLPLRLILCRMNLEISTQPEIISCYHTFSSIYILVLDLMTKEINTYLRFKTRVVCGEI